MADNPRDPAGGTRHPRTVLESAARPREVPPPDRAPEVPPDFWEHEPLRAALTRRHMGHVIREYRNHPFHGRRALPQEHVGTWCGISQAQLSRIESGSSIVHIDRLTEWAQILEIPQHLLWFSLPPADSAPLEQTDTVVDSREPAALDQDSYNCSIEAAVKPELSSDHLSRKTDRRTVLQTLAFGRGIGLPLSVADTVNGLRRQLDETLSYVEVGGSTVSHWQDVADGYGRVYRASPPMPFLVSITQDIGELQEVLAKRLSVRERRAIHRPMAQMTGLLATTLVNLNDYREARGWFRTAQRAAEESESLELEAWVMVRHAVSALYWHDPHGALRLATKAAEMVGGRGLSCVAAAWAPAVQARAYAQFGHGFGDPTREAIGREEIEYDRLEIQAAEQDAYGYSAAQLHFYRSNALTEIGDTSAAYEAQAAALSHYGSTAFLDSSLVRLDRAICLIKDNEHEEAAHFAGESLRSLPGEYLSPIIAQRARQFVAALPHSQHSLGSVQDIIGMLPVEASR